MKFAVENLRNELLGPMSFHVDEAESLGISGPSGCGKTRLLRCLADLEEHEGILLLDGRPSTEFTPPDWRRRVGLLPTDSQWWEATVGRHFDTQDPDRLTADLAALGFDTDVMQWRIDRMSSGEKQRLAVLRLLQNRPEVLLLDEPTANLDPDSVGRVENFLRDYQRNSRCAILWVSHDMAQIQRLCDRHLPLQAGAKLNTGHG